MALGMRSLPAAALSTGLALGLTLAGTTPCQASPAPAPGDSMPAARSAAASKVTMVLAISVDGLRPDAITRLGREDAPNFHRLIDEGAGTLNARTEREQTVTLPNHTGMLTGRRIDKDHHGHGVTWDGDRRRPRTVQEAAGHPVASVFSRIDSGRRDPALFASKEKFSLFKRSWPQAIDRFTVKESDVRLARAERKDLVAHRRAFTFLHLSAPDKAGHAKGWMSPAYLDAVRRTDARLGRLLRAIDRHPKIARHLVLVLTADHGGKGLRHSDPTRLLDYRVPFLTWGAGVAAGADLYDLNPKYADPGERRTTYAGHQPIRNGNVANLATSLLGLKPVPGSRFGKRVPLRVQ